jgi:circadian clock protein KaiC
MSSATSTPLPDHCRTGIEGLDQILGGGLPCHRLYLVRGDPGVGKTTLALQFLLNGAEAGEPGLYITLSETKEEMDLVARSHGWSLERLHLYELTEKDAQLHQATETTFFHPSEVELNRTTETILDEVRQVNPARVVFDSLSELRMLADTPLRYRRQILRLKQFFSGRHCTVLFLDDNSSGHDDLQVESIAHGVIALSLTSPDFGAARRRLKVQKIRGQKFSEGFHDFTLHHGGLTVFPRLIASDHRREFTHETFPSGIEGLDQLLGGGIDRGTSTMFMGPPGTGKSTLALKFAHAANGRGEKVHAFIFDESVDILLGRAAHLGMDFSAHVRAGRLRIHGIDPAEISPGELTHRIRQAVLHEGVRMILIDSLNGFLNAMPGERHLNLQLHELLAFLNQQGVLTIMMLAQQGSVGVPASTIDLTYLADTVVLFRYFELGGAVRQAISVLKKRSGNHERTIREITVDARGIRVGQPLTNMHGVLSGLPIVAPISEHATISALPP